MPNKRTTFSKHFIPDRRFLGTADVAKYNPRLKELNLSPECENEYGIYYYEPAKDDEPVAYWICKTVIDTCPTCHEQYKANAIASVTESKLTHYCRVEIPQKGKKPEHEIRPATLYLRRVRWRCYNCHSKYGKYNEKMQDDSKLVQGNEKLTIALKDFLGQRAMCMETAALAQIFKLSEATVKNCFQKELSRCDSSRNWDDIKTLGLYTVKLNVQGQETICCLCTDADSDSLIELFPYGDTKAASLFLNSLKAKQNIRRVLTSVDGAACNFAENNFPHAELMVDRVDIRKRLLNGLASVKVGNESSPDFPLLRSHWNLLDNIMPIPDSSKESVFLENVLSAFPRVGVAYWLKEAGLDIYRYPTGQRKRVDDWIFSDKHSILPYEQLEQCMLLAKEPVIQFAENYYGVDRQKYEDDILAAEKPLVKYVDLQLSQKSAQGSRAASFQMVRAHILYGTAMRVNYVMKQMSYDKTTYQGNTTFYDAMCFCYESLCAFAQAKTTQSNLIPEIFLHNFRLPLVIIPVLFTGDTEIYYGIMLLSPLREKDDEVKKMPRQAKQAPDDTSKMRDIETYTHDDKKRTNNPPAGMAQHDKAAEKVKTYQFDPHLDPELQWAGKAEGVSFEVPTSSIHIHESIKPLNIIARVTKEYSKAEEGQLEGQTSMFEAETPAERMRRRRESIEFYQHGVDWTNRMIAGDSLVIMNSLLEKEGMAGQVQMIYIDPPYGIKYGSNFQPFVGKRNVTDRKDDDLSQEPEMIKAFRDTWELGIHSYLSYLRNRLLLACRLLSKTGSVFVQISEANLHHIMELCAEVFGNENLIAVIPFKKTSGKLSAGLDTVNDYIVWYAKEKEKSKYHQLYLPQVDEFGLYTWVKEKNGTERKLTAEEKKNRKYPEGATLFRTAALTSQSGGENSSYEVDFEGKTYHPAANTYWKTNKEGMATLIAHNRVIGVGDTLAYKRFATDFPVRRLTNWWDDTIQSTFATENIYVVQTYTKVIQRCMLMATDPGDLILDITCGSGTTAYVAEQWGRRWITCDTSRVAITLAKQRLMTATFDYYKLAHEEQGVGSGFVYKTVPHITLKSIANNEPPVQEILYDQPEIDKTKMRVTGPFTVEALPAPVVKPLDDVLQDDDISAKQADWRDQLLATGILGRGGARLEFSRVEPLSGTRFLQAEAETKEATPRRAVICFAGETKPLDSRMVALALDEAENLRPAPKLIVFAAFQFDPEAAKDIDNTNWPGVTLLKAQMNTDLMTEDLKKKRSSDQSFWLVGQPDVELIHDKRTKDKYKVKVNGFDYYDVKKGVVESGGTNRIAMWMLDTDYDGMCIEPDMVFFPMSGKKDGWNKLAKTLRTEINMDLIGKYAGTESLWFTAQPNTAIAVKIIDDRGIESLKVIRIGDE